MTITHYDLFAGIGGFSLALEEVFKDATIRHIFCEWEQFPTSVLRRHWPEGEFWGDIAELVTHTKQPGLQERQPEDGTRLLGTERNNSTNSHSQHKGLEGSSNKGAGYARQPRGERPDQTPDGFTIVTGGFPCQPFSAAGRRRGTADDRYQWPNMFEVIRNTKPQWVIAENVRGLVTWNEGMVLETVCSDLESEGYEVQPLIIPAVAVNAPHRRDRVWIIAHSVNSRPRGEKREVTRTSDSLPQVDRPHDSTTRELERADNNREIIQPPTDPRSERWQQGSDESIRPENPIERRSQHQYPDWERNWQEVAFATCHDGVDDGLQGWLVRLPDGRTITRPKHRQESLKAYGNGIVPQVAMQIMEGIKASYD